MGGEGVFQIGVDHSRLHHHGAVRDPNGDDFVHPAQIEHQASADGHGASSQPGSRTPGNDGHPVLMGKVHDPGDLLGVERPNCRLGPMVMVRGVVRIGNQVDELIGEVIQAHDFFKG